MQIIALAYDNVKYANLFHQLIKTITTMRLKHFFLTILFVAFATTPSYAIKKAKPVAEHVIFIGVDGFGSEYFDKANIPNIKQLQKEGCYTLRKRSVLPSSSAVNWASMYMGAGPELHGYTTWGARKPELPSRVLDQDGIFPTVFGELRRQKPKAEIGCLYEWDNIRNLVDTLALNYESNVGGAKLAANAVTYIKEEKPTLVHICFGEPDHVGHTIGWGSDEYYAKLSELDTYIGQIIEAVKEADIYDNSIIIFTSDHGGFEKGHGGKTMVEMETPFIITGKGIKHNHEIAESMMQFDIAPTIARILALSTPQVWIGRPVEGVFK